MKRIPQTARTAIEKYLDQHSVDTLLCLLENAAMIDDEECVAVQWLKNRWKLNMVAMGCLRDALLDSGADRATLCYAVDRVLNESGPKNASAAVIALFTPMEATTMKERIQEIDRILTEAWPEDANPIVMALFPEPNEPFYAWRVSLQKW
jgi:hypothetical protein